MYVWILWVYLASGKEVIYGNTVYADKSTCEQIAGKVGENTVEYSSPPICMAYPVTPRRKHVQR